MEKQLKQLKLNVTNIKSVLIKSNKSLVKIGTTNSALNRKQLEQKKQKKAEKKIEMPRIPAVSGVLNVVKGVATSFFDKILGFFGSILIGFFVNKLPEIIEELKEAYKSAKPVWDGAVKVFGIIGDGFKFIYDNVASIFSPSDAKKELGAAEDALKELDRDITNENLEAELSEIGSDVGEDDDVDVDVDIPESSGELPTSAPVISSSQTSASPPSSLQPQPKNRGGEVTKTTQPKQQSHIRRGVSKDEMGKLNPFRMYPTIASSQAEMLKEHQKNAEAFQKVFKDMKEGSFFGGGSPGRGSSGSQSSGPGTKWTGGLVMNAGDHSGNTVVTSAFGPRFIFGAPDEHMGVDIAGPEGTPLIAFTDGKINDTGFHSGYGNYVAWSDSFGTEHFYAHMRGPAMVSLGQQVKKGTKLGEMGNTGRSTAPHLHWEVATRHGDTGMSKASYLTRFNALSKYPSTAPFGGATIKGGTGKGGGLGAVNNDSDYRIVYMPIEVEEIVRKPRSESNSNISMVNSKGKKKKLNPIHRIP